MPSGQTTEKEKKQKKNKNIDRLFILRDKGSVAIRGTRLMPLSLATNIVIRHPFVSAWGCLCGVAKLD